MLKKLRKDFAVTIHVTATEQKYLRALKRKTGLSISDLIREEFGLSTAAEEFFLNRKKNGRLDRAATSGQPVQ